MLPLISAVSAVVSGLVGAVSRADHADRGAANGAANDAANDSVEATSLPLASSFSQYQGSTQSQLDDECIAAMGSPVTANDASNGGPKANNSSTRSTFSQYEDSIEAKDDDAFIASIVLPPTPAPATSKPVPSATPSPMQPDRPHAITQAQRKRMEANRLEAYRRQELAKQRRRTEANKEEARCRRELSRQRRRTEANRRAALCRQMEKILDKDMIEHNKKVIREQNPSWSDAQRLSFYQDWLMRERECFLKKNEVWSNSEWSEAQKLDVFARWQEESERNWRSKRPRISLDLPVPDGGAGVRAATTSGGRNSSRAGAFAEGFNLAEDGDDDG